MLIRRLHNFQTVFAATISHLEKARARAHMLSHLFILTKTFRKYKVIVCIDRSFEMCTIEKFTIMWQMCSTFVRFIHVALHRLIQCMIVLNVDGHRVHTVFFLRVRFASYFYPVSNCLKNVQTPLKTTTTRDLV